MLNRAIRKSKNVPKDEDKLKTIKRAEINYHAKPVRKNSKMLIFKADWSTFVAPVTKCLPTVVLVEMLGFLKREDIEKLQMVSRQWNRDIINCTYLPLRIMECVSYVPNTCHFFEDFEGFESSPTRRFFLSKNAPSCLYQPKGLVGKDVQVHGFRNTVISKLTVAADEKTNKMMRKLYKFNDEEKIICKEIVLYNFYNDRYKKPTQVNNHFNTSYVCFRPPLIFWNMLIRKS